MSEKTVYKYIDSLKKFSFENSQAKIARNYILENNYTKRSSEELSRIEIKIKELEDVVKDMPNIDKTRN